MQNSSACASLPFSRYGDVDQPGNPLHVRECALPYVMLTVSKEKTTGDSKNNGTRKVILPADAASESKVLRAALEAIRLLPGNESTIFAHRVSSDPLHGGGGGVRSLAVKKPETAASFTYRSFAENVALPFMRSSSIDLMEEDETFLLPVNEKDEKTEGITAKTIAEGDRKEESGGQRGCPTDEAKEKERKQANLTYDFHDDTHPFRGRTEVVMSPKEAVLDKSGSHEVKVKEVSYTSEDKERGGGLGSPFSFPADNLKELSFSELKHGVTRWVELDTQQQQLAQQLDATEEQEMFYGQTIPFQRYRAVNPPSVSTNTGEGASSSPPLASETLWRHSSEIKNVKPSSSESETEKKNATPNDEKEELQKIDLISDEMEGFKYSSFTSNGYPGMPIFPLPEGAVGPDGALLDFFPGLLARRSRARNNVRHTTDAFLEEMVPLFASETEEKKFLGDVMKCVSYLQI